MEKAQQQQKAHIVSLPVPSRWRSILLGLSVGLLLSAFLTSNFSGQGFSYNPLLQQYGAWLPATTTTPNSASFSSQLFILLFRRNASSAASSSSTTVRAYPSDVSSNFTVQAEGQTLARGATREAASDEGSFKNGMDTKGGRRTVEDGASSASSHRRSRRCDLSLGRWVEDPSYPLYPPGSCPFVDEGFSCHLNGRPDSNYTGWRWAPRDCVIPRLDGSDMLERLKGKRVVFVGDSLNRDQWESLLCILWQSLPDKKRIVEVQGGRISKLPGAYVFKYLDYNCSVEFYTSHFLVDEEQGSPAAATKFSVRLDRIDKSERRWRKANVLVFNTGHWWTPDKIGDGDNYFREGDTVHEKLDVMVAYRKAIRTWARWVEKHVNPATSQVFFRGYSPAHYVGGQWNSGGQCHTEMEPIFNESYLSPYPDKMRVVQDVISGSGMRVPVRILNITRLSDFRKDAHPAIYGQRRQQPPAPVEHQDCSHWCLPGLPDAWNELLYFALFFDP